MGGQQFGAATTLVDTRRLKRVVDFDATAGIIEAEAGWPALMGWLIQAQTGRQRQWGIVQKQTGADRLSLGGALAANIHGRGLRLRPVIGDGRRRCSRAKHRDLFRLAIGDYGLFGIIASVRLRLTPKRPVGEIRSVVGWPFSSPLTTPPTVSPAHSRATGRFRTSGPTAAEGTGGGGAA